MLSMFVFVQYLLCVRIIACVCIIVWAHVVMRVCPCALPRVCSLWTSVSGMSSSSWLLLVLLVWLPNADGLNTQLQLIWDSFLPSMCTSRSKEIYTKKEESHIKSYNIIVF